MKHKVKSKLEHNSRKKGKRDLMKLTVYEQRVANILEPTITKKLEIPALIEEDSGDTSIIDVHINFPTEKDDINIYEQSPPQYQAIETTDTQEESQMSIAKSLQEIIQQNREILYYTRKTYHLKVEDSKKRQAYQSAKLDIYRRELEIMQTQVEMDKLACS